MLDSDKTPGDNTRVQLPHPEILAALRPGHALLLDDGKVRLIAEETSPERAVTRVVIGGRMSDRKGVSLPDTDLPVSAMTPKDRADLEAALVTGVDWIALSFVQRAEDVIEAKKLIRGRAAVMAKIEKPQAIDRLAEIIEVSDALMVARGDLGVELPLERVPSLQKQMTRLARRAGKPVVVATQMLESMIQAPVPTRAEVSDVATAVYEGADAIMLSAESAAGKFPVEAVSTMNRIGEEVERDPTYRGVLNAQRAEPEPTVGDAIADAARQIAETLDLSAIICWTSSGSTALRVARERPKPPVVAITPNLATGRKLSLVWGVHCVVAEDAHDLDDMVSRAGSIAFRDGFAKAGQRVIIVAGVPLGAPGTTNMVRIASVGPAATRICDGCRHSGARKARTSDAQLRIGNIADSQVRNCVSMLASPRNDDGNYCSVASSVIFVFSSFDTGQPALAMPASSSNFALSAPGIFAFSVRCTEVMAKPSPCFSSVTSALVSICSAVSLASPRISDSAMVKQAACAAPISSSGLVPGLPSKRLAKP